MSVHWYTDMVDMHEKYGVGDWFEKNRDNQEVMQKYLKFRLDMCQEEMTETLDAFDAKDPEEIVDGLIDLCVFAIGTLEVFGVNGHQAWDSVFAANMNKEVGVKEGRPNPFGLPDLIKPEGWTAPSHRKNHGDLDEIFPNDIQ